MGGFYQNLNKHYLLYLPCHSRNFFMFLNYRKEEVPSDIQTDICIIGAGAAGITLAKKLSDSGLKVSVLESGGFEYEPKTQDMYKGENIGQTYLPLNISRLRYLGGTTNHWAGWCVPLDELDFQKREWIPHSGWPINRSDLDPYYVEAQKLCQLGPFEYDADYWSKEIENFPNFNTQSLLPRFQQFSSPATRFGTEYKEDLEKAKNVTVYLHTNVTNININEANSEINSISIDSLEGKSGTVTAKKYILACGGIENPRLLLASNDVMNVGIGNQNDLVGRFFMEHAEVYKTSHVTNFQGPLMKDLKNKLTSSGTRIGIRLCPSPEHQKKLKIANSAAIILAPSFSKEENGYTSFSKLTRSLVKGKLPDKPKEKIAKIIKDIDTALGVYTLKAQGKSLSQRIHEKGKISLACSSEQIPNPDSRVVLSTEKNKLGNPRANLDWQLSELDYRTIRENMLLIGAEFSRLGVGRVQLDEWIKTEEYKWPKDLTGGSHHMGTTRMSDDPSTGVVDKNCKVHGISNLYVAGSSVFTTGGQANPTLTIVALALRLAEHLKTQTT